MILLYALKSIWKYLFPKYNFSFFKLLWYDLRTPFCKFQLRCLPSHTKNIHYQCGTFNIHQQYTEKNMYKSTHDDEFLYFDTQNSIYDVRVLICWRTFVTVIVNYLTNVLVVCRSCSASDIFFRRFQRTIIGMALVGR